MLKDEIKKKNKSQNEFNRKKKKLKNGIKKNKEGKKGPNPTYQL